MNTLFRYIDVAKNYDGQSTQTALNESTQSAVTAVTLAKGMLANGQAYRAQEAQKQESKIPSLGAVPVPN